uniref:Reverse transcriptase domain-containing protein n=2 Tax=Caenorhabditis japonica TaxID=281687 RepID=A0A8R1IG20_CAEJA
MRIINGDANWIKFLLDVGDGVANDYEDRVTLLEGLPVLEDLVDDVFGDIFASSSPSLSECWLSRHDWKNLDRKCILYSFAIGSNKGKDTFVPRITCYEDKNLPFHLKRTQFPVKLAFAISINKAQGQSFGRSGKVPEKWKTSNTTLIFKKGDKEDLENYRPICLLPVLYKAFTKCVLNRIRTTIEEAQPVEQAGFRRSFSTIDHIHSIQRLLEVGREYQQPLTLVFIDFHKAFDSVEPQAIWESLKSQGVQPAYIALLQQCYTNCTTTITPFHKKIEVPITKGVRQGDPISPNLFSACLESVFNKMSWQHLRGDKDDENDKAKLLPGIRINGQNLTHLRFADDIVLVASNPKAASLMIQELVEMCGKVGLRMNTNKTKVMRNKFASQSPVNLTLNNVTTCIEEVNEYVYLGRLLNHNNELEPELYRRRRAAWGCVQ